MKLLELISCDIYRDGGSLEATWKTAEEKDWVILMKINSWDHPDEVHTYRLFNCNINQLMLHQQIVKGSVEHLQLMTLVEDWETGGHAGLATLKKEHAVTFDHLLNELRKGNY